MQTTQTLLQLSPVLFCDSRCSQAPLEQINVLSDSSRAISATRESTCSYRGVFRMLQDWTIRMVKFWSYWDLGVGLQETSRAPESSVQVSRRPLLKLCGWLDAIFSQQWFLGFHNHRVLCLSYSSLLQWQDWLHHNVACIIEVSLYKYIWSYRDNGDGLSNRENIFGRPRSR